MNWQKRAIYLNSQWSLKYLSLFIFSYGSIRLFTDEKNLLKFSYISEMVYYIFEFISNDNSNKLNCSFIIFLVLL